MFFKVRFMFDIFHSKRPKSEHNRIYLGKKITGQGVLFDIDDESRVKGAISA